MVDSLEDSTGFYRDFLKNQQGGYCNSSALWFQALKFNWVELMALAHHPFQGSQVKRLGRPRKRVIVVHCWWLSFVIGVAVVDVVVVGGCCRLLLVLLLLMVVLLVVLSFVGCCCCCCCWWCCRTSFFSWGGFCELSFCAACIFVGVWWGGVVHRWAFRVIFSVCPFLLGGFSKSCDACHDPQNDVSIFAEVT